ncbi:MAG TPA: ABC transporter substrate-binding protein, partial [Polyangiaceae bacterium]
MRWGRLGRTLPAAARLVLLVGTACSDPIGEPKTDGTLDLLTWWSVPGEQTALSGLLETYSERHPQTRVNSSAASSRIAAENQLESLFVNDAPPDSFLTAGGEHLKRHVVAELGEGLESVDAIAERADFTRHLPNVVRAALTHDGKLYGIPLDIPRLNVLLYNADVFAGSQLEPPTTLEEFYTVCEALRARNVVPFAIGTRDGSVLSQMLFDALLATPELLAFRDAFLSGDADPNDARLTTAVTELGRI